MATLQNRIASSSCGALLRSTSALGPTELTDKKRSKDQETDRPRH